MKSALISIAFGIFAIGVVYFMVWAFALPVIGQTGGQCFANNTCVNNNVCVFDKYRAICFDAATMETKKVPQKQEK